MALQLALVSLIASLFVVLAAANPLLSASWHLSDRRMHPEFVEIHRNVAASDTAPQLRSLESNNDYWLNQAKSFVQSQSQRPHNKNVAKNIIFFIGDGMSATTLAATRMLLGGEERSLSFEQFPVAGMAKTYCVDVQVADSACSATAYLGGIKAREKTIGVGPMVRARNCAQGLDSRSHVPSIAKWAMDSGKVAGLVTTTRVTHASPAGVYAHTAFRDWENNAEVLSDRCDDTLVDDIAEQLVHGDVGKRLKVVLGCGRREFIDASIVDEEGAIGKRSDGKNLIDEWKSSAIGGNRTYVWNRVIRVFLYFFYIFFLLKQNI